MPQPAVEKRATRRFPLKLVVILKSGERGEIASYTRDVSARGVNFYCDVPLAAGSDIQFTLTLPPEVTLTESISMRCMGTVVRVEPSGRGASVAAVIDRYVFLGGS